jgi:hypothetical protein
MMDGCRVCVPKSARDVSCVCVPKSEKYVIGPPTPSGIGVIGLIVGLAGGGGLKVGGIGGGSEAIGGVATGNVDGVDGSILEIADVGALTDVIVEDGVGAVKYGDGY